MVCWMESDMREAAIWILCVYTLAQAWVIWYFFVYKQNEADKKYERKNSRTG